MRSRITLAVLVAVLAISALVASPLFAGAQTGPTEPAEDGTAPDSSEPDGRQDRAESFLATFAEELGVSTEEVDAAFDAAVTEQLGTAVADGDLSQEQADRIAERLADRDLADLFGGLSRPGGRGGHGWGRGLGGPWGRLGSEFGIGRGSEEVTGQDAERASEAALAAVGGGEVRRVVRSDAEGAEYFVAVRNDEGLSGVLLDSDFEVLRTQKWNREGEDEGREDRDTSALESDAA